MLSGKLSRYQSSIMVSNGFFSCYCCLHGLPHVHFIYLCQQRGIYWLNINLVRLLSTSVLMMFDFASRRSLKINVKEVCELANMMSDTVICSGPLPGVDNSQQNSSNDFMNYFTYKIDTIRDQIVTMQQSATVSHQIVHYRSPEEQFSTIGEEELYKLVKSAKPTTCMLDPISSQLLKEVLPEVRDPLLAIINSSLSLGCATNL